VVLKIKDSYENIMELIQINESIRYTCQKNLLSIEQFLFKQGRPKGYSSGTSYMDADLVRSSQPELGCHELQLLLDNMGRMEAIVEKQDDILSDLYLTKNNVDTTLALLTGISHEVGYLRLVKGLPLQEIAEKLHISLSYVKRISAKL